MMNIDEKYVKEYLMNNILGNLTGFVWDHASDLSQTKHPKSTMNWRSKKLKIRTSTLNNI